MNFRKTAAALLAAAISAGAATAQAAANDDFVTCIKKDAVTFDGTIVDAAVATPALSTLVSLVQSAGLVDALATTQNITVFAPTNDAFAKIPEPIVSAIAGDSAVLTEVLTYHVVAKHQDPRRWVGQVRRNALNGQMLFMGSKAGVPFVNNSTVDCTAVKTDNGTVWIIDSVLLPQF
ncbi:MAG: fasciclin domain-containing protein [Gammaproteobacteria bacterium]